mgnify:CR=1 FL=1
MKRQLTPDSQKLPRAEQTAKKGILPLLGPAFVAAVAYVDPGNVAANITAGARYGYLLVWVLVLANLMAVIIQYQSAKLGVSNRKIPTAALRATSTENQTNRFLDTSRNNRGRNRLG